jgi:large conductance mechanosensitive channel
MNPVQPTATLAPTQKAFSLLGEFKNFAFRGTMIDLTVGVIIGAAFGKIIDSLVKHIVAPLGCLLLPGEHGYLGWKITLGHAELPVGLFLGDVFNFLIVALTLFVFIVKFLGWLMKAKREEAAAPAPLTKDQELLSEIRDLLKSNSKLLGEEPHYDGASQRSPQPL